MPQGAILIAETLRPADAALIDPARIARASPTEEGGADGHTAIMLRALGVPAVLGAHGLLRAAKAAADGGAGRRLPGASSSTPGAPVAGRGPARRGRLARERQRLARLRRLTSETTDHEPVELQGNLELLAELPLVAQSGAAGIGLFRTEFLFMNRETLPDEAAQTEAYRTVIEAMDGDAVTIRVLDWGGEKDIDALRARGLVPDTLDHNPALGVRGLRLLLRQPDLFETQLAAILRAARAGPVRVLLPMVTNAAEVRAAREIYERVARRLRRRGEKLPDTLPPLGIMIETPGAALAADALALEADFFAIGTNDLAMYTLAVDRAATEVAKPVRPAASGGAAADPVRHRSGACACACRSVLRRDGRPTRAFTPLLMGLGPAQLQHECARRSAGEAGGARRLHRRLRALCTAGDGAVGRGADTRADRDGALSLTNCATATFRTRLVDVLRSRGEPSDGRMWPKKQVVIPLTCRLALSGIPEQFQFQPSFLRLGERLFGLGQSRRCGGEFSSIAREQIGVRQRGLVARDLGLQAGEQVGQRTVEFVALLEGQLARGGDWRLCCGAAAGGAFARQGRGCPDRGRAALRQHVGIAAGIFGPSPVAFGGNGRGHDAVEEIAVVADQKHGALVVGQHLLQQIQRLEIEVVGRLVEDHQVALAGQRHGQHQPAAFAAGEHADGGAGLLGPEQEILHVADDVALLAADEHLVAGAAGQRFARASPAGPGFRASGRAKPAARLVPSLHRAAVGRELAGQQLQQCGLAGAVRSRRCRCGRRG